MAAAEALFGTTLATVTSTDLMALPIAAGIDQDALAALYAAPGAMTWSLDEL